MCIRDRCLTVRDAHRQTAVPLIIIVSPIKVTSIQKSPQNPHRTHGDSSQSPYPYPWESPWESPYPRQPCKIGYNSAYIWYISEILASNRGFRGLAIERCQSHFSATDPGCHGNEIWVKIGYNSAYVKDMSKVLASTRGFWCLAIERCQLNSCATDPGCSTR